MPAKGTGLPKNRTDRVERFAEIVIDGGKVRQLSTSGGDQWLFHKYADGAPVCWHVSAVVGLSNGESRFGRVVVENSDVCVTEQGVTLCIACKKAATVAWDMQVAADAHLSYMPGPVIPLPLSKFSGGLRVSVAPDASFTGSEVYSIGRVGRGERYEFGKLDLLVELWSGSEMLHYDRQMLRGRDKDTLTAAMGGYSHMGTMFIVDKRDDSTPAGPIAELLESVPGLFGGVSRASPRVLTVRALSDQAALLERAFWRIDQLVRLRRELSIVRPEYLGRRWMV